MRRFFATLKCSSGWNKIVGANASAADADLAIYWRIADGTEADPINLTAGSTDERYGWYLRITGHNAGTPIDVTGTPVGSGAAASHLADEITTTVADCLAIAAFAYDGADAGTFSFSGTGWTMTDQRNSGTGGTDAMGAWGSKSIPSAGLTADCTLEHTNQDDGCTRVQFAIRPAGGGGGLGIPIARDHYIKMRAA